MEEFIKQVKASVPGIEIVFQDLCLEKGLTFLSRKYLEQKYFIIKTKETIRIFSNDSDRSFKLGDLVIRQAYASSTTLINSYRHIGKLSKIDKKSLFINQRRWAPDVNISFDDFFRHNSKSFPITEKEIEQFKYRELMGATAP